MILTDIFKKIQAFDTIIIHRHVRPDPDAIGSQCGLKQIIKTTFPNKAVYAVGEEEPTLTYLASMDKIDHKKYDDALVIVCDTANTDRVCDDRYNLGKEIIKIDHHPNHDPYGDILWVNPEASSTSEMIFEWYKQFKDVLKMNEKAARLIYAGIVGDTGRFLFPNTTNKTFQYAAELINFPFDRQGLYDQMYETSRAVSRLQGQILQEHTLTGSGLGYMKLTKELLDAYHLQPNETSKVVGTLGNIEGIHVWVTFVEESDVIRARIRSKKIVINTTAKKYNGGGHKLAAGASVHSWREADQLIDDLNQLCKERV